MTQVQAPQPSDIYPPLTWERLMPLARAAFDCRKRAYADAAPEIGDDVQVIGFRAWKLACFKFTHMAAGDCRDFLSIRDPAPNFTMMVKLMPIRFCRGDGDEDVPANYAPDANEREQFELALGSEAAPLVDGCFRLLNEHDHAGAPVAVRLALVDRDGVVKMSWQVPIDDDASGSSPIVVPQTPVRLPDLDVQTLAEAEAAAAREKEDAERDAAPHLENKGA